MSSEMSFTVNRLDRRSAFRGDADFMEAQFSDSEARYVLSTPTKLILDVSGPIAMRHKPGTAASLGLTRKETILLGLEDHNGGTRPLFAGLVPQDEEEIDQIEGLKCIDLRALALQAELPPEDLGALSQARALIHWHRTHKFCSQCGHPSDMAEAGYRRDCPSCGGLHFPRTDPCVIMLITDGDKALLGRPPRLAEGVFTTLAGFMEPGEILEDAVRRETFEEAGIRVGDVQIISSQPWPFPANLMVGCRGVALNNDITMDADELEAVKWCSRDEVVLMMEGKHPEGHIIPPSISIAYHLIVDWVNEGR